MERAQQIQTARAALEQALGREPLISEVSSFTGLSAEDVAEAQTALIPAESLQKESGEEGLTLEHVLGDPLQEERMLEHVTLRAAIESLPVKEQQVIQLRFYHGLTQSDSARILNVSQVQVSRLEKKAVDALRLLMS